MGGGRKSVLIGKAVKFWLIIIIIILYIINIHESRGVTTIEAGEALASSILGRC